MRGIAPRACGSQTTGHESMTVLRRYVREGNLFNENAVSAV
jgi:hypothetical protein